LQHSGREEAGSSGRGNSCPAEVGGRTCGIQRSQRHAGSGTCGTREEETEGVSARAHSPAAAVDAASRWKPSKPRATGDLGRHRPTGPIGLCRSAALIKTERCASAGMQRDHGSAHRTPTWVGRCDLHSAFSMPVGAGLTFIRCVAAQLGARWSLATSSRAHAKAGQNKRHGTAEQQLLTWDRVTTPRPPKRT
jgi:hypothetical protein